MSDIATLIQSLTDFRTRAEAEAELTRIGQPAVAALLETLSHRQSGAKWSAAKILGDIGGEVAVDGLIRALKDESVAGAAANSLERVTGEKFGADFDDWQNWRQEHGGDTEPAPIKGTCQPASPAATEPVGIQDKDAFIKAIAENENIELSTAGKQTILDVKLPAGRRQKVYMSFHKTDDEGLALVTIFAICGPATEKNYEFALKLNPKMHYGAVGISNLDGKPHFVLVNSNLAETITLREINRSILEIAQRADKIELQLTGKDKY